MHAPTSTTAHLQCNARKPRHWMAAGVMVAALALQACGGGSEATMDAQPVLAKTQAAPAGLVHAAAAHPLVNFYDPNGSSTYRLEEVGDGTLSLTVSVGDGSSTTGDIRALYFHMSGDQSAGLVVSGSAVTRVTLGTNNVVQAGGRDTKLSRASGVNTTGGFDVGVEIGTRSITGADDVQTTTLVLSRPGGSLTLADFSFGFDSVQGTAYLGLVAQRVGAPGTNRRSDINTVFEPIVVLPPPPPPPPPTRQYDVGAAHLCVGTFQRTNCVGDNSFGQSPDFGSSLLLNAVHVAAGVRHSCGVGTALIGGVFVDNAVACWGAGGDRTGRTSLPQPTLGPAVQVAAGNDTTCALTQDGAVTCWAATPDPAALNTYTVSGIGTVVDLAVGSSRACAVNNAGGVSCWFKDGGGNAGVPSFNTPMLQVDAWGGVACATNNAGGAECWGISDATVIPTQPPSTITGITQVAVGHRFACAATTGGVSCWATELLAPDARVLAIPPTLGEVTSVQAGGNTVCAQKRSTSEVVCWGDINQTFFGALPE